MNNQPNTPVIAGNWKMHKGPNATRAFFDQFNAVHEPRADRTIVFFPPAASLPAAVEAVQARPDISLGVQNIHWEEQGAFTGETSGPIAREAGARYTLIGHSERRHLFGETDDEVRRKVEAALRAGLIPVICVGETLAERQAGRVEEVILRQLDAAMAGVRADYAGALLLAYEPVWAIGTGVTATPADASAAQGLLQRTLIDRWSRPGVPILYGGSVKPDNAADLLAADFVAGLLVGGASLDPHGFARIASAG
jgi:triosephosphate isomerase